MPPTLNLNTFSTRLANQIKQFNISSLRIRSLNDSTGEITNIRNTKVHGPQKKSKKERIEVRASFVQCLSRKWEA